MLQGLNAQNAAAHPLPDLDAFYALYDNNSRHSNLFIQSLPLLYGNQNNSVLNWMTRVINANAISASALNGFIYGRDELTKNKYQFNSRAVTTNLGQLLELELENQNKRIINDNNLYLNSYFYDQFIKSSSAFGGAMIAGSRAPFSYVPGIGEEPYLLSTSSRMNQTNLFVFDHEVGLEDAIPTSPFQYTAKNHTIITNETIFTTSAFDLVGVEVTGQATIYTGNNTSGLPIAYPSSFNSTRHFNHAALVPAAVPVGGPQSNMVSTYYSWIMPTTDAAITQYLQDQNGLLTIFYRNGSVIYSNVYNETLIKNSLGMKTMDDKTNVLVYSDNSYTEVYPNKTVMSHCNGGAWTRHMVPVSASELLLSVGQPVTTVINTLIDVTSLAPTLIGPNTTVVTGPPPAIQVPAPSSYSVGGAILAGSDIDALASQASFKEFVNITVIDHKNRTRTYINPTIVDAAGRVMTGYAPHLVMAAPAAGDAQLTAVPVTVAAAPVVVAAAPAAEKVVLAASSAQPAGVNLSDLTALTNSDINKEVVVETAAPVLTVAPAQSVVTVESAKVDVPVLVAQPAGATESVVTVTQAVPAIKIEDGVVAAAEKLVGSPSARASATGASWNPINWFSGSKAAAESTANAAAQSVESAAKGVAEAVSSIASETADAVANNSVLKAVAATTSGAVDSTLDATNKLIDDIAHATTLTKARRLQAKIVITPSEEAGNFLTASAGPVVVAEPAVLTSTPVSVTTTTQTIPAALTAAPSITTTTIPVAVGTEAGNLPVLPREYLTENPLNIPFVSSIDFATATPIAVIDESAATSRVFVNAAGPQVVPLIDTRGANDNFVSYFCFTGHGPKSIKRMQIVSATPISIAECEKLYPAGDVFNLASL